MSKAKNRTAFLLLTLIGGILFSLLALKSPAAETWEPAIVTHIVDGDTIDVTMSRCRLPWKGNPHLCRVRLACIDTPERRQNPFFNDASNRMKEILPLGTAVRIRDTGSSSYKRIVAEVFLENSSVNLQMVREGKAAVYCKYLNSCKASKGGYLKAEREARREGLGVWNPNQPWTQSRESQPCSDR